MAFTNSRYALATIKNPVQDQLLAPSCFHPGRIKCRPSPTEILLGQVFVYDLKEQIRDAINVRWKRVVFDPGRVDVAQLER